jgi:sporulation protein YlmC with PRC-barrel domain
VYRNALDSTISKTGTNVDFIIEGVNKYLMALAREQIKLAFDQAEKEVSFLRTRVKEGLKVAKESGTVLGRIKGTTVETKKSKEAKEIICKHSRSFGGSLDDSDVMEILNGLNVINLSTVDYDIEWRGCPAYEIGDFVILQDKEGNANYSYYLNETL